MSDPVQGLEHDHVAFSGAIARLKAIVAQPPPGDPASDLVTLRLVESLRDDLLAHFAKEEEGLFPFVARELPDCTADIDRLLGGHEVVCGCIVRLAHALGSVRGHDESAASLFARFERAYAEHTRAEVQVLREVGARLDPRQRAELAALIESL